MHINDIYIGKLSGNTYLLDKVYISSAILTIDTFSTNDDFIISRNAKTYSAVATSNQVLNEIISRLNLNYSTKDLYERIEITYKVVYDIISSLSKYRYDITLVTYPGGELIQWIKNLGHQEGIEVRVIGIPQIRRELSSFIISGL